MKLKKKSGLMGAVIALSAASLVSVGFASWVISQGDSKTVGGTIQADVVDNQIHLIEFTDGVTTSGDIHSLDDQIIFGYAPFIAKDGRTNYNWLSNDGFLDGSDVANSSAEKLEAVCKFTVSNVTTVTGSGNVLGIDGGFNVTATLSSDDYVTTVGGKANVLAVLPTPVLTYDADDEEFTCTITFGWGSYFKLGEDQVNPMTYYNSFSLETNPEKAEEANTVLTALNTLMNNLEYSLSLVVSK